MGQDPFSRLEDSIYDHFVFWKFVQVFRSVSGTHIYSLSAGVPRQFDIVRVVSDDERSPEIDLMVGSRKAKEMGIRLDALAPVGSLVRARVRFRDPHTRLGQLPNHVSIDAFYVPAGQHTFGNSRLISHDKKQEGILKSPQRADGAWEERHFLRATKMPSIFNQCAVPVEEYGWQQI